MTNPIRKYEYRPQRTIARLPCVAKLVVAAIIVLTSGCVKFEHPCIPNEELGCIPTPFSQTSMTGEVRWIGLAPGESPPLTLRSDTQTTITEQSLVLSGDQNVKVTDLSAIWKRLPSHNEPIDRVYFVINDFNNADTPIVGRMLKEICRINSGRPKGQEAGLVVETHLEMRSSLAKYLATAGCGLDDKGQPLYAEIQANGSKQMWMQDTVEFFEIGDDKYTATAAWETPKHEVVYLEGMVSSQKYPFLGEISEASDDGRGAAGGNLESLPDGRLLLGDSAKSSWQQWVSNHNGLILPSNWLKVGHIDEWLSVRPNGTVLVADPMEALQLFANATDQEWTQLREFLTGNYEKWAKSYGGTWEHAEDFG